MEKQMEKMRPIGLTTLSIDELGERAAAIAQDIQFAMTRAMTDIVSLGEILLEVKQRSEFGRYGNYGRFLAENGLEERMAQYSVAAYKRYAQKPEILTALGSVSKLKELLALPEAMEEEFLAVRDVQGMSARELRQEVRAARQQAAGEAQDDGKEKQGQDGKAADSARICALEKERDALKAQIREIQENSRQIEELDRTNQERLSQAEAKQSQLRELLGRLREERGALEEENMKLKQAALHQGEHRESDENGRLSGATFTQNVRKFLSENGEVPMMQGAYDEMISDERSVFLRGLDTLQTFIGSARAALCGLEGEATIR